jgi:5-methylthioribose kinase
MISKKMLEAIAMDYHAAHVSQAYDIVDNVLGTWDMKLVQQRLDVSRIEEIRLRPNELPEIFYFSNEQERNAWRVRK